MRICVIGTGYVGLVTSACLAAIGHQVVCVDNNPKKATLMQLGESPIYEPQLTEIVQANMAAGRLEFTIDLAAGVSQSKIIFITVNTPTLSTGERDTSHVEAVAREIGNHLNGDYKIIVNKSIVPIDSGDWVGKIILDVIIDRLSDSIIVKEAVETNIAGFDVVSNPEFFREGSAIYDTFNPDRIVLGSSSEMALAIIRELYQPIVDRIYAEDRTLAPVPIVITDLDSAEKIKYDLINNKNLFFPLFTQPELSLSVDFVTDDKKR